MTPVETAALTSIESQARYITRPALAIDALHKLEDGDLALEPPPDPRTGVTSIALDPHEWIYRPPTFQTPETGDVPLFFALNRTTQSDRKVRNG